MCLEARTETRRNGWGGARKKNSVNNKVEAGSMRGAAHSFRFDIEELCENRSKE